MALILVCTAEKLSICFRIYQDGMRSTTTGLASSLNFSWLIDSEIAGARGPRLPEHLQFLRQQGIRVLVRMSDRPSVSNKDIQRLDMIDYHEPVPDMTAPSIQCLRDMVRFIQKCLSEDKPVCVTCDGGYGRTATLLTCYMITEGLDFDNAIKLVKKKRPGSVLTIEQQEAVEQYSLQQMLNPPSIIPEE